MNTILTAEELLSNNIDGLIEIINDDDIFLFYKGVICEFAKTFAELHVQEALKAAADNSRKMSHTYNTILNSYPLENIV